MLVEPFGVILLSLIHICWTTASVRVRPPLPPSARGGITSDSRLNRRIAKLPDDGFGRNWNVVMGLKKAK